MTQALDRPLLARTLIRTSIGGALGGIAAYLGVHALGLGDPYWITLSMLSLGVSAGAFLSGARLWPVVLSPALATVSTFALYMLVPGEEAAGLALWGLGTTAPLAVTGSKRWLVGWAACAAVLGIVSVAAARVVEVGALSPFATPSILGYPIAGAVVGFVLGLAGLPRSLGGSSAIFAPSGLGGELRTMVERAIGARTRVRRALRKRPGSSAGRAAVEKAVEELVRRVVTLARRWRGVDEDLAGIEQSVLEERLAKTSKELDLAPDAEAREEYERAKKAIEDQIRMHRDIRSARERTIARLEGHVAALDRVHLAVVRLRSADAQRFASEIRPVLDELSALGSEAELHASAMDEARSVS